MKKNIDFRIIECLDPNQFQYMKNWFKDVGKTRTVPPEEIIIKQALIDMGVLWFKEGGSFLGGTVYGPTILGLLILEILYPNNPHIKEGLEKTYLRFPLDFS